MKRGVCVYKCVHMRIHTHTCFELDSHCSLEIDAYRCGKVCLSLGLDLFLFLTLRDVRLMPLI